MKDNQASSTAYTVLQGLIYASRIPSFNHLLDDVAKDIGIQILSDSNTGRQRLKQIEGVFGRNILKLMERLLLPNISLHYLLRKAYIESKVRYGLKCGVTQVINLGAGFDTLLTRLANENDALTCIEIDHPATHIAKQQALINSQYKTDNLHFIPVDFTKQTLEQELGKCAFFDPDAHTLCVIEGVLMYLNEEQIFNLFRSLHELLKFETRHLVFTAIEPVSSHPESYGPLLKLYLKFKDEPLNWTCHENMLGDFMAGSDFTLIDTANGEALRREFVPKYEGPIHRGEFGAYAVSGALKEES